jgi:hypothetical protein
MYQLEAAQLLATSPKLQRLLSDSDLDEDKEPSDALKRQFKQELLKEPAASAALKKAVLKDLQSQSHSL